MLFKLQLMDLQIFFQNACSTNSVEKDIEIDVQFSRLLLNSKPTELLKCKFQTDVAAVEDVILNLKNGKASGCDGIVAEHLKFAHPVVYVSMTKLFNLLISMKYVPTSFGLGLIFPIPKNHNHSSHYKLDEFRGITVSPVVSKVFEHCLYRIFSEFLTSSPNQFDFKKGKGTRDAIFTLCESVTHFVDNDSTVNICTLDISKAFDKINHHALFIK